MGIWIISIICAAAIGLGLSLLITSLLLNHSNNLGDSRLNDKDFSSDVIYFSKDENLPASMHLAESYVKMSFSALIASKEYTTRKRKSLRGNDSQFAQRYIPVDEDESELELEQSETEDAVKETEKSVESTVYLSQTEGGSFISHSEPQESAWAAARRRNLQESASANPWGRDRAWGTKQSADSIKPIKVAVSAAAVPAATVTAATVSAATASTVPSMETTSMAADAQTDEHTDEQPEEPMPIYDLPTADRPLWENTNTDDDFSDFEDLMQ